MCLGAHGRTKTQRLGDALGDALELGGGGLRPKEKKVEGTNRTYLGTWSGNPAR